ncbi:MAG: universal stress protein, partial [Actinomycetes bacterium]
MSGRLGGKVVVGVDDSDGARAAVGWALDEAARRGARLLALTTFPVGDYYWTVAYTPDGRSIEMVQRRAQSRAQELVDEVRSRVVGRGPGADGTDIEVVATAGAAADRLVEWAEREDLLVVGRRGHGAVAGALLGSVSLRSVMHARCPVVVVPEGAVPPRDHEPRIVVGVDASSASRAALTAAGDAARRMDASVEVVVVLEPLGPWIDLDDVPGSSEEQLRESTRRVAETTVTEVFGDEAGRPPVHVLVEVGHPAHVLSERAAGADLLVVGTRGRATLPGLVLGSVALRCVAQAPCPVMVVHPGVAATAVTA